MPYFCFPFICQAKFCSGCFRQVFFSLVRPKKQSLIALDRWSSYTVMIVWELAWVDSALVILDQWSFYRGGRLNRFDCIKISLFTHYNYNNILMREHKYSWVNYLDLIQTLENYILIFFIYIFNNKISFWFQLLTEKQINWFKSSYGYTFHPIFLSPDSNKSVGPNSIPTKFLKLLKMTFPVNSLIFSISLSHLVCFHLCIKSIKLFLIH